MKRMKQFPIFDPTGGLNIHTRRDFARLDLALNLRTFLKLMATLPGKWMVVPSAVEWVGGDKSPVAASIARGMPCQSTGVAGLDLVKSLHAI